MRPFIDWGRMAVTNSDDLSTIWIIISNLHNNNNHGHISPEPASFGIVCRVETFSKGCYWLSWVKSGVKSAVALAGFSLTASALGGGAELGGMTAVITIKQRRRLFRSILSHSLCTWSTYRYIINRSPAKLSAEQEVLFLPSPRGGGVGVRKRRGGLSRGIGGHPTAVAAETAKFISIIIYRSSEYFPPFTYFCLSLLLHRPILTVATTTSPVMSPPLVLPSPVPAKW